VVSYDLKSLTMLHGKNGFERLVTACEKVLNQKVNWLFCNVAHTYPQPDPLSKHFPVRLESLPGISQPTKAKSVPFNIPPSILATTDRPGLEEWASDLYEWMSLVRLGSPRIETQDSIDSYLSRYDAPIDQSLDTTSEVELCKATWQGLIAPEWFRQLLVEVITTCPSQPWFFISASTFSNNFAGSGSEIALLRPPEANGEYVMWEIASPE
jgi:ribonuclease P/MRP protein subunit RPP40